MDRIGEQPTFPIKHIIEQQPFERSAVQDFFRTWCEANDSLVPEVVSRAYWEKGAKGRLFDRGDGKKTLYIPRDVHLWEMVGVMETVDRDTFAAKPERQGEAKAKLMDLGNKLQNTGVYIAQRLDAIQEGRGIASALAEELYGYGQSLTSGIRPEHVASIGDIVAHQLTPEEVSSIDRFLAGEELYSSRHQRVGQKAGEEQIRRDSLSQFSRVSDRAFRLQAQSPAKTLRVNTAHLAPWENDTPFHSAFLAKANRSLTREVEMPKTELVGSVFRRGMDLLQKNMPFDKLQSRVQLSLLHWQNGEKTLREALQINEMKTQLTAVKKTGDIALIGQKEREIAETIQLVVSEFPYDENIHNPSEMIISQNINCVGASMLGGALMSEQDLRINQGFRLN